MFEAPNALRTACPRPGRNNLDAQDFLSEFPDGSAACVFFDPQYRGVLDHMKYGNEGARQRRRAALPQMSEALIRKIVHDIARVLRPSGHMMLWLDKFHMCNDSGGFAEGTDLRVVDMIIWDKEKMGMGWRSRRSSEFLLALQKPPYRAKGVWRRHDIRDICRERVDNTCHPHTKPIGMQADILSAVTRPGDLVLDPAAGSYSVMKACENLGGRVFYGADILEHPDPEDRPDHDSHSTPAP